MVLTVLVLLGQAPAPELLDKLAEHDTRAASINREADFTVSIAADELDADGKPEHSKLYVVRVSNKGGERAEQLLKVLHDGKDVTEAERPGFDAKREERKKAKPAAAQYPSPFSKAERPKYRFSLMAADPKRPAVTRIAFRPGSGTSSELMTGDAEVDTAEGELLRLTLRPSKMPSFVDHLLIVVDYGAATPRGRAVSKIDVRGDGGFAFVRRRYHLVTAIDDVRLPGAPVPASK